MNKYIHMCRMLLLIAMAMAHNTNLGLYRYNQTRFLSMFPKTVQAALSRPNRVHPWQRIPLNKFHGLRQSDVRLTPNVPLYDLDALISKIGANPSYNGNPDVNEFLELPREGQQMVVNMVIQQEKTRRS